MWSGLGCPPGHYGLAGREGSVQSMRDERLARLSGDDLQPGGSTAGFSTSFGRRIISREVPWQSQRAVMRY